MSTQSALALSTAMCYSGQSSKSPPLSGDGLNWEPVLERLGNGPAIREHGFKSHPALHFSGRGCFQITPR
jgi:hypothetical protein